MHRRIVTALFVLCALGSCRARVAPLTASPDQFCAALDGRDYGTAQRILQREHVGAVKAAALPANARSGPAQQAVVEAMVRVLEAKSCAHGVKMGAGVIRTDPPIKEFSFGAPARMSCDGQFSLSEPYPLALRCERKRILNRKPRPQ